MRRVAIALAVTLAACSGGRAAITYGPVPSTTALPSPASTAVLETGPIVVESLPGAVAGDESAAAEGYPGQGPTTSIPANSVANGPLPADVSETLACIRSFEGDYGSDTDNGYYGAYQFDPQTWESVGGTGNPADASPDEQDARAAQLLDERGLAPWPTPSRRCQ